MTTDWSKLWGHDVWVDGKQIPADVFWRQKRFESLSAPAQHLLRWHNMRKKQSNVISLVELTKCLTPPGLRKTATIRAIMNELVAAEFAKPATRPVYYSGHLRRECWRVNEAVFH